MSVHNSTYPCFGEEEKGEEEGMVEEDEEEKEMVEEEEEAKGRKQKEEKRCTHRQLCVMEVYSIGSCTRQACDDVHEGGVAR